MVTKHEGYEIRGVRFNTLDRDGKRVTQNSGVKVLAKSEHFASAKDNNPILAEMTYYGVIREIWDVNYTVFRIPVFKCDWVDSSGVKVDEMGFTCVNLNKIGYKSDPFIMASQVQQVFYVEDQLDSRWSVVLTPPQHRTFVEEELVEEDVLGDTTMTHNQFVIQLPSVDENDINEDECESGYVRNDYEGIWIKNIF